jgi:hypothetical protein
MNKEQASERHRRLTADGWVRRFTAEEPRLSEMKEYYSSLGLEVLVEQGAVGDDDQCRSCFDVEGFEGQYQTIYTREAASGPHSDDDLFE